MPRRGGGGRASPRRAREGSPRRDLPGVRNDGRRMPGKTDEREVEGRGGGDGANRGGLPRRIARGGGRVVRRGIAMPRSLVAGGGWCGGGRVMGRGMAGPVVGRPGLEFCP